MQHDHVDIYPTNQNAQLLRAYEPRKPRYSRGFLLQWIDVTPKACQDLNDIGELKLVDVGKSHKQVANTRQHSTASFTSCRKPFLRQPNFAFKSNGFALPDRLSVTVEQVRQVETGEGVEPESKASRWLERRSDTSDISALNHDWRIPNFQAARQPSLQASPRQLPTRVFGSRSNISLRLARTPEEAVRATITALLNKLTPENFDSICDQIGNQIRPFVEDTIVAPSLIMDLIMAKAKDEALWSTLYADLCQKILAMRDLSQHGSKAKSQDNCIANNSWLRQHLSQICRAAFDNGWSTRQSNDEVREQKTNTDQETLNRQSKDVPRAFEFSDAYYAEQRSKRQGLGLLKFVGELLIRNLIETEDVRYILLTLLEDTAPREENVESICRLLNVVGFKLDCDAPEILNLCMERVRTLQVNRRLGSRHRFMLSDVISLRDNGWITQTSKVGDGGPQKIQEIHRQDVAKLSDNNRKKQTETPDKIETYIRPRVSRTTGLLPIVTTGLLHSFSRTTRCLPWGDTRQSIHGSRAGDRKIVIDSQLVRTISTRKPKPSAFDGILNSSSASWAEQNQYKSLSKISSASMQSTSSAYSTADSQPSTDYDSPVEEAEHLSPSRTVSLIRSDLEDTLFSTAIDNHLAELWGHGDRGGTRNPKDILAYFESLDNAGRAALATKLVQDAFRLGKMSDTDVIAQGLSLACERELLTANQILPVFSNIFKDIEDILLDVPQGSVYLSKLLKAVDLDPTSIPTCHKSLLQQCGIDALWKEKLNKEFI